MLKIIIFPAQHSGKEKHLEYITSWTFNFFKIRNRDQIAETSCFELRKRLFPFWHYRSNLTWLYPISSQFSKPIIVSRISLILFVTDVIVLSHLAGRCWNTPKHAAETTMGIFRELEVASEKLWQQPQSNRFYEDMIYSYQPCWAAKPELAELCVSGSVSWKLVTVFHSLTD